MTNRISKIIFLIGAPFNKRDYERFGVDVFIKNGFEVCIWDFTPLLFPKVFTKVKPPGPINYRNLFRFYRKKDALEVIRKEARNTFFVSLIPFNIITFSMFRAISKCNLPYCVSLAGATLGTPQNMGNSLARKIRSTTIRKLIDHYLLRIPPQILGIHPAVLCFVGGQKSIKKRPEINKETQLVWIHTYDYDIYLKTNKKRNTTNTAVFIDNYVPFHPDYLLTGRKHMKPDDYYPLLNRFFTHFENKSGLEIVIAAHPRSHYEKFPYIFVGRKVIRGRTSELVRDSKCVILHTSTAINFCVLFKKPMIFITTNELKKHLLGRRAEITAPYFGKTLVNISDGLNIDLERELLIDDTTYSTYRHNYIKVDGTEELPFWQVVSNRIKSLDV